MNRRGFLLGALAAPFVAREALSRSYALPALPINYGDEVIISGASDPRNNGRFLVIHAGRRGGATEPSMRSAMLRRIADR